MDIKTLIDSINLFGWNLLSLWLLPVRQKPNDRDGEKIKEAKRFFIFHVRLLRRAWKETTRVT